ncbi:MAG: hypothetical protein PEPC_01741 [Peptostreptococcus russellii]
MITITIIITFLNEKGEVFNTLDSIIGHTNDPIDIIVINDCSNDGYDYDTRIKDYNVIYIKNPIRLGVAESRNVGVKKCRTSHFLLLDAHMRMYDDNWVKIMDDTVTMYGESLYCFQTKHLYYMKDNPNLMTSESHTLGARIDLYTLEPQWIKCYDTIIQTTNIPCVLGANYLCSTKLWEFIKGLTGLQQYGLDETFLSFKAWIWGFKCFINPSVTIGHIYRSEAPYVMTNISFNYNKVLIAELLLPMSMKNNVYNILTPNQRREIDKIYKSQSETILELSDYFNLLPYPDYNSFYSINSIEPKDECLIKESALSVVKNMNALTSNSLMHGKMGCIIFLYSYAQFSKETFFTETADTALEELLNNISTDVINMEHGLLGIGWGIQYLIINDYCSGDIDSLLFDIDKVILNLDFTKLTDYTFNTGVFGILFYILSRVKTSKTNIFDNFFLSKIYSTLYPGCNGSIQNIRMISILKLLIDGKNPSLDYFVDIINFLNDYTHSSITGTSLFNGYSGYGLWHLYLNRYLQLDHF